MVGAVLSSISWAQVGVPRAAPVASQPEPPLPDPLGRETPRGAVLGFVTAARSGDYATARRYLNTPLRSSQADALARQLAVVLDRRLPARLNQLSPRPEGSLYYPDRPNADLVGTIDSLEGPLDIVVQRVDQGKRGTVWLFSKETLDTVPELYEEVNHVSIEDALPAFLTEHKIAQIPLFQWLFVLVGMPLAYILTGLLDRVASPFANRVWQRLRRQRDATNFHLVPRPVRLLLLVLVIRWMVASLNLNLLARQFWSILASVITIAASCWLLLIWSAWGESKARRSLERNQVNGAVSILRLVRRTVDVLVLIGGVLVLLFYFNMNVTAALAGLGVGGIAVALAAQKTLENVIGGISIVADRVVRVGDFLKIGDTMGTVEEIGVRSTRIRTLERSLVSIPNGQISNERLEDLSHRDKFWFHPILSLRYETTAAQMRSVLEAIRSLLLQHALVEQDSVRVRFLRFGSSSLDVDVFAYTSVHDFGDFLEVQEELLLQIMDAVQSVGTRMALPSQTTFIAPISAFEGTDLQKALAIQVRN